MATILGIHFSSCPYCAECPINQLCLGPCLGSQYESNKNLFVPIPSVCALSWSKLLVVAEKLEEFGAFGKIANIITPQRAQQLEYLRRENHFAKQN